MTDQPKGSAAGKVVLGCGGLLLLVSLGVTLFCAFHVFIDPRGAISRSEAMPGFLAGGFFTFISIVVMIVGGIVSSRKPSAAAAAPGGAVAQGAAAPSGPKPFPAHFLVGCGTLFIALMSCGSCGSSTYYFDRASTYDRYADEDARRGSYGGYRSILGESYYRSKASKYRTYGGVFIAFGMVMLLVTAGAGFGTARLAKRYREKTAPPPAS